MKRFEVIEGEGIAGPPTQIAACTSALANCMGIVIVGEDEAIVGLFHYPGLSLKTSPQVQAAIIQMLNDIQPEKIYLTPAKQVSELASTTGLNGSAVKDVKKVTKFLNEHAKGASVTEAPPGILASFQLENAKLVLNKMLPDRDPIDASKATVLAVPGNSDSNSAPARRMLAANILYYGGRS